MSKHDPLCDYVEATINNMNIDYGICVCDYITAARVNERKEIAQQIDRFTDIFGSIATPLLRSVAESIRKGERLA